MSEKGFTYIVFTVWKTEETEGIERKQHLESFADEITAINTAEALGHAVQKRWSGNATLTLWQVKLICVAV
tara:strand:+ start:3335 stop:3547 length:213 start_codon:yes stop_codon:yes gene_type:complete